MKLQTPLHIDESDDEDWTDYGDSEDDSEIDADEDCRDDVMKELEDLSTNSENDSDADADDHCCNEVVDEMEDSSADSEDDANEGKDAVLAVGSNKELEEVDEGPPTKCVKVDKIQLDWGMNLVTELVVSYF